MTLHSDWIGNHISVDDDFDGISISYKAWYKIETMVICSLFHTHKQFIQQLDSLINVYNQKYSFYN